MTNRRRRSQNVETPVPLPQTEATRVGSSSCGSGWSWKGYIEISSGEDDFDCDDFYSYGDYCYYYGSDYCDLLCEGDTAPVGPRLQQQEQQLPPQARSNRITAAKYVESPQQPMSSNDEHATSEIRHSQQASTRRPRPTRPRPLLTFVAVGDGEDSGHVAAAGFRNFESEGEPVCLRRSETAAHDIPAQSISRRGFASRDDNNHNNNNGSSNRPDGRNTAEQSEAVAIDLLSDGSSDSETRQISFVDCGTGDRGLVGGLDSSSNGRSECRTHISRAAIQQANDSPAWYLDPTPAAPHDNLDATTIGANPSLLKTRRALELSSAVLPFLALPGRDMHVASYSVKKLRRDGPPPCCYCAATAHRAHRCPLRRCEICGKLGHCGFKRCPNAHLRCRVCRSFGHDSGPDTVGSNPEELASYISTGKPLCPYQLTHTSVAAAMAELQNRGGCSTIAGSPGEVASGAIGRAVTSELYRCSLLCCIICGRRGHLLCISKDTCQSESDGCSSPWSTDSSSRSSSVKLLRQRRCSKRNAEAPRRNMGSSSSSIHSNRSNHKSIGSDSFDSDDSDDLNTATGSIQLRPATIVSGVSPHCSFSARTSSRSLPTPHCRLFSPPALKFCCRCAGTGHQFTSCPQQPSSSPFGSRKKSRARREKPTASVWGPAVVHCDEDSDSSTRYRKTGKRSRFSSHKRRRLGHIEAPRSNRWPRIKNKCDSPKRCR